MEFLNSINQIRKTQPFHFYMMLIVIPFAVVWLLDKALNGMGLKWEWNIYIVSIIGFLAAINFVFWLKCHYQRLNRDDLGDRVIVIFDVVFIAYGLLLLLFAL